MKIGFISDIHGNYEALRQVLNALDKIGTQKIFCLGDVVGYYSQVNECCNELRRRKIPCVMGNHDWYLASGVLCKRSKSVNECIKYQRRVITPENLEWVRTFPVYRRVGFLHMVHGGWENPIDEYLREPSEGYFMNIPGEFFFSGHTHIQLHHTYKKQQYCNPGSVGQPRDFDPRAAFAVYDKEITLHRVAYDINAVGGLMDAAGFNDYYYGGLFSGAPRLQKAP
jgi:predicted phosphodiesterase